MTRSKYADMSLEQLMEAQERRERLYDLKDQDEIDDGERDELVQLEHELNTGPWISFDD